METSNDEKAILQHEEKPGEDVKQEQKEEPKKRLVVDRQKANLLFLIPRLVIVFNSR